MDGSADKAQQRPPATARYLAWRTFTGFFAYGFGSGLSPRAPGTMGTLLAIPLGIPLMALPQPAWWLVWVLSCGFGIHACEVTSRRLGVADPGGIVWDEMVAYWLCLAFIPVHWAWWLAAFVLFRFFDIVKPWPIRQLDRAVKGGLGIMLDDLVAAGYALLLLVPAAHWLPG